MKKAVLITIVAIACFAAGWTAYLQPTSPKLVTPANEKGLPKLQISCNADSFGIIWKRFKEDLYISATLTIGDKTWNAVRLRLRGDTSREFPKKSIKLKIDDKGELPFGRKNLNLNAEYLDKTKMRQYLCTRLYHASGQPCYDTRHVQLYLNGYYQGVYLLVENVEKDFLAKWKLSESGDLYKATKDSACLSHYDNVPALWEKKGPKGDSSFLPLEALIAKLNQTPDREYAEMVKKTLNYENMVNAIALNMLIGNRSTYYHNYFMYLSPKPKRWNYLPWDMDNTFVYAERDDPYHRGNLSDSHWGNMASNPLFERAITDETILKDIQARVEALAAKYFNPQWLFPIIDSLDMALRQPVLLDSSIQAMTNADWEVELAHLKDYVRERPQILKDQFAKFPHSFRLIQPTMPLHAGDTLRWTAAIDPNGDALTYRICYCQDAFFPREQNTCKLKLPHNYFVLPQGLAAGKYFWKVLASDGTHEVRGFDTRSTFIYQVP
ncbi:MAG: CotH kinase family protein [Bacteroidia bacterium]